MSGKIQTYGSSAVDNKEIEGERPATFEVKVLSDGETLALENININVV